MGEYCWIKGKNLKEVFEAISKTFIIMSALL